MFSRTAALAAAGVLAITGLATGTANAAAPFTDAVQISNNLDGGTHGHWAWVLHRRAVNIAKTAEGANGAPDTYRVVLTDSGALTTIKGAKSPQAGVTIARAVTGSFGGRYTFTVVSATPPSSAGVANSYNYGCQIGGSCPGRPATTSNWPSLYFDANAQVTPNNDWRWDYRTCAESWTNSAAGNSGDITGALCDARVATVAPTVTQPACDTVRGTLVVPARRGVVYEVRGRTWVAGEHKVRPGSYRVAAKARDGYVLRGDRRWTLTVDEAKVCSTPTPTVSPTVEPTATPTPTPTVTETAEPTPAPTVTRTNTRVIVVGDVRVPARVDTGLGGLSR